MNQRRHERMRLTVLFTPDNADASRVLVQIETPIAEGVETIGVVEFDSRNRWKWISREFTGPTLFFLEVEKAIDWHAGGREVSR